MRYVAASLVTDRYTHTQTDKTTTVPLVHARRGLTTKSLDSLSIEVELQDLLDRVTAMEANYDVVLQKQEVDVVVVVESTLVAGSSPFHSAH